MPYLEKLKALKEEKELTNSEIARISNIPLATITRVFNGATPNPTFETISQIAIALGTSLDEIAGLKEPDEPPIPSRIENTLNSYSELLKEKDDRIRELKDSVEKERKEKHMLQGIFVLFIAFMLVVFTIDMLNGHFGYFKY
jgi:transcriptional regulator with XRE-family HTH domain